MVRTYVRKTQRGLTKADTMQAAVRSIVFDKCSTRKMARKLNISRTTMAAYVTKFKVSSGISIDNVEEFILSDDNVRYTPHYDCRQVFTSEPKSQ